MIKQGMQTVLKACLYSKWKKKKKKKKTETILSKFTVLSLYSNSIVYFLKAKLILLL